MAKFANINARIEPDVLEKAEEKLNVELEKGYADIKAGRVKPAAMVFANIRKDYNL